MIQDAVLPGARRWLSCLVVACTTLTLTLVGAGCGGDDDASGTQKSSKADEQVNVAFFGFAKANSFAQGTFAGVEIAAKANNAKATFFDGQFDSAHQLAQIQDATVSGKYDAFVVQANDGNSIVPALEEAAAQGISVVGAFTPIGPDLTSDQPQVESVVSFVGESIDQGGSSIGRLITKACEGKDPCQVAYMPGANNLPLEKVRTDAVKAVLAESSNIEVVAEPEAGYLRDTGLKAAQDVLQSNPDVDVIASSGDQPILGAEEAVKSAGLSDQVALIGAGASRDGVEAIKAKRWFGSIVWLPQSIGEKAAEFAIKAARGEKVPSALSPWKELSPIGEFATQDNVAEFEGEWDG
jgi:ribose transport system substrate-binding protein